jgi:hypothetical protein
MWWQEGMIASVMFSAKFTSFEPFIAAPFRGW